MTDCPEQLHWDGCATAGGPAHYECAVAEVKRLNALIEAAGEPWLHLDVTPPIPWEEGIDGAMRAACAEITRLRALTTPQPIETAPDRTTCLVFIDEFPWPVTARRTHGRWSVIHPDLGWARVESRPTHWLPLPEAPK